MYINNKILVGKNEEKEVNILANMINRHGLITGASGTGKTVTLKVIAESFSDAGIPVFLSDVKGDLAGTCLKGEESESVLKRVENLELENFEFKSYPVRFWDLYGKYGHPIRTKISTVGPNILSIMLGLNEIQEGILNIAFKIAEDENLPLIDLKDLKTVLQYIADNRKDYNIRYGNITPQSVGGIQRSLLVLENQGADKFFGEPSLDIFDFISLNNDGRGVVNILNSVELFKNPDLYASFMLWLLTELFNKLPEVGDLEKPKIAFFFDEAHLLFDNMPSYRLKQITQIVKLIRSKAIGLYFISQNPTDIPDEILGQLGNRVQHALRAYTPSEQKIVKAAAGAFRTNPMFDTEKAILELATGEALVSFQNEFGEPSVVEKVKILPPQSKMGTIDEMTYIRMINSSSLAGKYDVVVDNLSAHEIVSKKYEEKQSIEELEKKKKEEEKLAKEQEKQKKELEKKKKNDPMTKLEKKIVNKTVDKAINKGLNKLFKNLFK